jgi:hypothetical protein
MPGGFFFKSEAQAHFRHREEAIKSGNQAFPLSNIAIFAH